METHKMRLFTIKGEIFFLFRCQKHTFSFPLIELTKISLRLYIVFKKKRISILSKGFSVKYSILEVRKYSFSSG